MPAWSVRNLLAAAEKQLQTSGSARLDAEILLASTLQTDRGRLYAWPEQVLSDDVVTNFHCLLLQRLNHYPVAYLTGNKEFWSLELQVDQHTLIPRPETECLVETALEAIPAGQSWAVLDIGTGSGAIALAIARERPACRITAVDISVEALSVASGNAARHGLDNIRFVQSDWFSELQSRRFDVIVANPPYVESGDPGFLSGEIRHEPRLALDGGRHGMQAITHLVPAAAHYLRPAGQLVIEHGYKQAGRIRALFAASGYRQVQTRQDYAGLDRLSAGVWP